MNSPDGLTQKEKPGFLSMLVNRAMYSHQNNIVVVWTTLERIALAWFVLPLIMCHLLVDEQSKLDANTNLLKDAVVYQLHYVDANQQTHSITELPSALNGDSFETYGLLTGKDPTCELPKVLNPTEKKCCNSATTTLGCSNSDTDEINRFFNSNLKAGEITMGAGVQNLNLALLAFSIILLIAYQARSAVWAGASQAYTDKHYYLSVFLWIASPVVVAGCFFNGFRDDKWDQTGAPVNGKYKVWLSAFGVSMWFLVLETYFRRKALKIQRWMAATRTNQGDQILDLQTTKGDISTYELASVVSIIGLFVGFAFSFLHLRTNITVAFVLLVVGGLLVIRRSGSVLSRIEDTKVDIEDIPAPLARFIFVTQVIFMYLAIVFLVNHWDLLDDNVSVFHTGDFFYTGNAFMLSMIFIVVIMAFVGWIAKPWVHDNAQLFTNIRDVLSSSIPVAKKVDESEFEKQVAAEARARAKRLSGKFYAPDRASLVRNDLNFV